MYVTQQNCLLLSQDAVAEARILASGMTKKHEVFCTGVHRGQGVRGGGGGLRQSTPNITRKLDMDVQL